MPLTSFEIRIVSVLVVTFFNVTSKPSTKLLMVFDELVSDKPFSVKLASLEERASVTFPTKDPESIL